MPKPKVENVRQDAADAVRSHVNEFAFCLGATYGGLKSPDVYEYLTSRGISHGLIEETATSLGLIAGAFYRDPIVTVVAAKVDGLRVNEARAKTGKRKSVSA